jgi:hypothetical protein
MEELRFLQQTNKNKFNLLQKNSSGVQICEGLAKA